MGVGRSEELLKRTYRIALCCMLTAVGIGCALLASLVFAEEQQSNAHGSTEPWSASQTVEPAALVKELADAKASDKPIVICVGFHTLYAGAHIPGASFHGAASTSAGLDDLKNWARALPRSTNLVVYCGCCPLEKCPNVRPAFQALRDMGFTHLRVLLLPHDFASDWVAKDYPVEKSSPN
jgi:thiosulfate/3-mercaptopyruvate sulfurtransferase